MVHAQYSTMPKRLSYMPLPDGLADIRLCVNIRQETDAEGNEYWACDENYFRADMAEAYVAQHFDELLAYKPPVPETEPTTEELLLQMAADHEMRLCLIEMGVEL